MKAWRKVKMEIKNYEVGDQIMVKLKDLGRNRLMQVDEYGIGEIFSRQTSRPHDLYR